MTGQTLTCQWCNITAPADEFELDEKNMDGFWCPDCDGHTYFSPEKNKQRRMLLLLETRGTKQGVFAPVHKLKKRLSPLRYPGGKSKMADFLSAQFRNEQLETFVEVFAGGASVGLALLDAGITKKLVLNDLDAGVFAFWETVVKEPRELIRRLIGPSPSHDTFLWAKAALDNPAGYSTPELAWAQLIANRLGFSGITKAGALGGRSGSDKALLARWNPAALRKRILHIANMADAITVTQKDAATLLEESAYWDGKSTCFVDPPYVEKGAALYRCYFSEEDHRDLAFTLNSLYQGMPGADIVITYDDCPLVRDLYPLAEVVELESFYSIAN